MRIHFEEDRKWHHFAFEADAARVRELRAVLRESVPFGEVEPLRAFYDRHARACARADRVHVVMVDGAELRRALADVQRVLGALGRSHAISAAAARARELTNGGVTVRSAAIARVRHERLERLVEAGAPEVIVEAEIEAITRAVHTLFDPPPEEEEDEVTSAAEWFGDDLQAGFESCVELCGVPFAPDVGLGGLYELFNPVGRMLYRGDDPFWSDTLMPPDELVDRSVPVHHEIADLVARLCVGDGGPVAWAEADALVAFARSLRDAELDLIGLARLREEAAVDESPTDFTIVRGADQPEVDSMEELVRAQARRYAERCEDIAARGNALLTWIGKNPAL